MKNDAFLNVVSPGPACVIPEDKKIFRVTVDVQASMAETCALGDGGDAECENGPPPLPVPHMYSA